MSTTTLAPVCPAPGGLICNDDDACTDDFCTAGVCENVEKTGIDSVLCTCGQSLPDECVGTTLPKTVQRLSTRACRLFDAVTDAPARKQIRRLKQAARALLRAKSAVVRAQRRGLAPECAAVLAESYGTTSERAVGLAGQVQVPR
jgi:hypothetical protein